MQRSKKSLVVFDVLEHVEQPRRGQRVRREAGVFASGADDRIELTRARVDGARAAGSITIVEKPAPCRPSETKPLPAPMSAIGPAGGKLPTASTIN